MRMHGSPAPAPAPAHGGGAAAAAGSGWEMLSLKETLPSSSTQGMPSLHHPIQDLACMVYKCKKERNLAKALHLHSHMLENGLDAHTSLGNDLVSMLVEVGSMTHARQVFDRLVYRDECSWNSLITGYVKCGESQHALTLYQKMQEDDSVSPSGYAFVALLKACATLKDLERGCNIHSEIVEKGLLERDVFIGSTLVHMYANCGFLSKAQEVFDKLPVRNVVSWNALIAGYVEHGHGEEALYCFEQMQHKGIFPNAVTFVCSLKACGSIGAFVKGCEIHAEISRKGLLERNAFVASTLVDMYAKCGSLAKAQEVLDKIPVRNVVSWNALIAGYGEHGHGQEALYCFKRMQCEGISPDAVTLVCILKSCGSIGATEKGQEIHTEISRKGLERELLIGNTLVDMYAKCGLLAEAQVVFDKLGVRAVVSWTALIAGYANHGRGKEALYCYEQMQHEGVSPDAITFLCSLTACGSIGATIKGREIHAEIVRKGLLKGDIFLGSALVDVYAKSGLLVEAQRVFDELLVQDVVLWNALIAGYAEHGHGEEALNCFEQMQHEGISPDAVTLVCCLKACGTIGTTVRGSEIHAEIVRKGLLESDLGNTLVDLYAKSGSLAEAVKVFDKLPRRSIVSWNALIAGYVEQGHDEEALNCLEPMQQEGISLDAVTLVCSLKACGSIGATTKGQEIHAEIAQKGLERELLLGNTLVDMYAKCSLLAEAQAVFDKALVRTVVSWNALIAGYADYGQSDVALNCFKKMEYEGISSDAVTLISSLKACGKISAVVEGREIHSVIARKGLERELLVGSTLVDMYAKCGFLGEAQDLLDKLPVRAAVSWTALIIGYAEHGCSEEAVQCFNHMQLEGVSLDAVTLVCSLTACGSIRATAKGRQIHAEIVKKGFLERENFVGSNLVDVYVKWGSLAEAKRVFDMLPFRDIISWNMLITGYVEHGSDEEALYCFEQMQQERVSWDAVSLVCSLTACGNIGAMVKGQEIHAEILRKGLERELIIGNTLVDMYAKCGLLANAQEVFDKIPIRDLVSWNALIAGYGQLGQCVNVFYNFDRMIEEGIEPDPVTFVIVLNSCSHAGLVDKGQMYFEAIIINYGLIPILEHYNCIIDLLGRAGQIDKAVAMINKMPFHTDVLVWNTVLGACRKWGDVELGRHAFEHAVGLDEKDAAAYVCMSNIYGDAAVQQNANKVKAMGKGTQAHRNPGPSGWTDTHGFVSSFQVGNKRHSQNKKLVN